MRPLVLFVCVRVLHVLVCVDLCGQPRTFTVYVLACVPTCPALLPVGPEGVELQQPHLCRATGFDNSLT